MSTALLVSPHLDDVAFSCGGIAARLARAGCRVVVVTLFTRSVHPATGFALECQRDKGLPDDLDYMALRREEDLAAIARLGGSLRHLDLPEAPHRGYGSARALFEPPRDDDDPAPVVAALAAAVADHAPDLLLAPQGCGRHVDHLRTIDAVRALGPARREGVAFAFYRDTPYVIRDPDASPDPRIAAFAPHEFACPLDPADLEAKQDSAACYRSQLGFQFGGPDGARAALAELARREADAAPCAFAERLRAPDPDFGTRFAAMVAA